MGIERLPSGSTVFTHEHQDVLGLTALICQLRSEIGGLRWRVSAYAFAKRRYGLKGNRAKVLAQLEGMLPTLRLAADGAEEARAECPRRAARQRR